MEVAGVALGALAVAAQGIDSVHHGLALLQSFATNTGASHKEHGVFMTYVLGVFFPRALEVMDRVERTVLHAEDQHVVAFLKSYTSSFNMIGVAGAIIAQVAVTAISLAGIDNSHWTAMAFFLISLITGCLSVFFSCAINPAFHGLHSASDIKNFLTIPSSAANKAKLNKRLTHAEVSSKADGIVTDRFMEILRQDVSAFKWQKASAYAAIMLVVPMTLLDISLNSFLIGLGVYLGKVYTAKLIPNFGSGSLALLIIFIVTTIIGIAIFYVPQALKAFEAIPLRRFESIEYKYNFLKQQQQQQQQQKYEELLRQLHTRASAHLAEHSIEMEHLSIPVVESRSGRSQDVEAPANTGETLSPMSGQPDAVGSDIHQTTSESQNIQSALQDLIKAQQAVLQASQRLLAAMSPAV